MNLVILTYIDRSGSTFVANYLNGFDKVFVFPEMSYLSGLLLKNPLGTFLFTKKQRQKILEDCNTNYQLKGWPVEQVLLNAEGKTNMQVFINLLSTYPAEIEKDAVCVFKQRFFPELIKNLSDAYPQVKILKLMRDPRAVYSSQKLTKKTFPDIPILTNAILTALRWKMLCNAKAENDAPNILTIKFEEIIRDSKLYHNDIISFFNIPPVQKEDNFYFERLPGIDQKLHTKILAPPDIARINAWKSELDATEIALIEKYAFEEKNHPYNKSANDKINHLRFYSLCLKFWIRILLKIDG